MITCKISKAQESDMMDVFNLANDPVVRSNSFNQNKIELLDHQSWFRGILQNQRCYFYIIRSESDFVGSMRFDHYKENRFIANIQISEKFRGKGLAAKIIQDATLRFLQEERSAKIVANIKVDNLGSLKSFQNSGYRIIDKAEKNNSEFYILEYDISG